MEILENLTLLGKSWDALLNIVRRNQTKEYFIFRDFIDPLNDQICTVHEDYRIVFRNAIIASRRAESTDEDLRKQEMLRSLKAKFIEARQAREFIRDKVRYSSQELYANLSRREYKFYMASVVHYFLEARLDQPDEQYLTQEIDDVIRGGGRHFYDTPFTRVEKEIREQNDPIEVGKILTMTLDSLNSRFAENMKWFIRSKLYAKSIQQKEGA